MCKNFFFCKFFTSLSSPPYEGGERGVVAFGCGYTALGIYYITISTPGGFNTLLVLLKESKTFLYFNSLKIF